MSHLEELVKVLFLNKFIIYNMFFVLVLLILNVNQFGISDKDLYRKLVILMEVISGIIFLVKCINFFHLNNLILFNVFKDFLPRH